MGRKNLPVNEDSVKLKNLLIQFNLWSYTNTRQVELDWLRVLPDTTHQTVFKFVWSFWISPNTEFLKQNVILNDYFISQTKSRKFDDVGNETNV